MIKIGKEFQEFNLENTLLLFSELTGIPVEDMKGKNRTDKVSHPRKVFCKAADDKGYSPTLTGKLFGQPLSYVKYSKKVFDELSVSNKAFKDKYVKMYEWLYAIFPCVKIEVKHVTIYIYARGNKGDEEYKNHAKLLTFAGYSVINPYRIQNLRNRILAITNCHAVYVMDEIDHESIEMRLASDLNLKVLTQKDI